jgi:hypothetical protein
MPLYFSSIKGRWQYRVLGIMSISICMIMRKYLDPMMPTGFHILRGRVGFLLKPIPSEDFFNQAAREVLLLM